MNSQTHNRSAADQRPAQWTWSPDIVSGIPSAFDERDQENARLRLALREAHHRSSNQWQRLMGLMELERIQPHQAEGTGFGARLHALISAFAMLNRTLDDNTDFLTGCQHMGVRAALESILMQMQATTMDGGLHFVVQDAWLPEKGCAALLLICAELVCNASKYGKRRTQVTLTTQANLGILEVRDDGPGFPVGFNVQVQQRHGLRLVDALCRFDLNGEMRCESDVLGGVVTVTFPVFPQPDSTSAVDANVDFCSMEGVVCFAPFPADALSEDILPEETQIPGGSAGISEEPTGSKPSGADYSSHTRTQGGRNDFCCLRNQMAIDPN